MAAEKIHTYTQSLQKVAILFGTESAGLSNEKLQRCDYHISIPTHSAYSALNLAAAVQVIVYEIYQKIFESEAHQEPLKTVGEKATAREVAGLLEHFKAVTLALGFMDRQHPKKLLPRIQRLLAKAQLEKEEINILRGFLTAIGNHK